MKDLMALFIYLVLANLALAAVALMLWCWHAWRGLHAQRPKRGRDMEGLA
jgi:hypothetical protein